MIKTIIRKKIFFLLFFIHVVKHTHSFIFVYTLIDIFTDRLSPVLFARIYSDIPGLRGENIISSGIGLVESVACRVKITCLPYTRSGLCSSRPNRVQCASRYMHNVLTMVYLTLR